MLSHPVFTIVTPALNCARYLPRNFASVAAQGLPPEHIEHWVIDGGSTDDTVELLRHHPRVKFISEKDRGLSHAVNKGIERAAGEWILWLNADDELAPEALPQILKAIEAWPDAKMFSGAQKIFDYDGQLEHVSEAWDYNLEKLLGTRTAINQASTIVHRSVYAQVGCLDETYRTAMDYEWVVRARHQYDCRVLPFVLSHYHRRPGSITDKGIADQHREFLRVRRKYGKSRFARAEFCFRFYLATEPLRKIPRLRRGIRAIKALLGHKPLHPMS